MFAATSTTNTSSSGTLAFSSKAVAGELNGLNNGSITFSNPILFDNFTYHATGNPLTWIAGNLNLAGNTLTIGANAHALQSGALNRSASSGSIVNNGVWTDDTGGFNTSLSTVDVTNNGVWNCVGHNYSRV